MKLPTSLYERDGNIIEDDELATIPAHVTTVKDGLLDFNRFVGLFAVIEVLNDAEDEDGQADIPLSAYRAAGVGLKESQRVQEREFLEAAQKLAAGARRIMMQSGDESKWCELFQAVVTDRIGDVPDHDSFVSSIIARAENTVWDVDIDPSLPLDPNPSPDLTFGFPVYSSGKHTKVKFKNDASSQNYTNSTLSRLDNYGLRAVTTVSQLQDASATKSDSVETQSPLLCFPWGVLYLKAYTVGATTGKDELIKKNFEEASVVASSALALFEKLARFTDVKQDGRHIPPVVTLTSVGPEITVWLGFSNFIDDKYRDHKMLSIWNGCIIKTWDAIQFCRLLDNLFFWARHILKPRVTQYLDQWRLRYDPEVDNHLSLLEKDRKTADLVHRIQDRLSSLGLSPNNNLPELIQQAVIYQEVMNGGLQVPGQMAGESIEQEAECRTKDSKGTPAHLEPLTSSSGASASSWIQGDTPHAGNMKVNEKQTAEGTQDVNDTEEDNQKISSMFQKNGEENSHLNFPGIASTRVHLVHEPHTTDVPGKRKAASQNPLHYVSDDDSEASTPSNTLLISSFQTDSKISDFEPNSNYKYEDCYARRAQRRPWCRSQSLEKKVGTQTGLSPPMSKAFELSFAMKPSKDWRQMLDEGQKSSKVVINRKGVLISKAVHKPTEEDAASCVEQDDGIFKRPCRDELPKVTEVSDRKMDVPPKPLLDVKIPWRGTNIRVKLPQPTGI